MIKHPKTVEEFDTLIKQGNVLVDFFTTWCGPCRMLSPIIEEISEEMKNLTVLKVDVEELFEVGRRYMIQAVPTLYHFKDGKLVGEMMGYQDKESIIAFVSK